MGQMMDPAAESSKSRADTSVSSPQYTMYLDQTSHLDWDWVRTFGQNYWFYKNGHGIQDIFDTALRIAREQPGRSYSICEVGFVRRYLEVNPSAKAEIQNLGDRFQIMSGGIVSPDCLLSSGEAFIRNYLVGQIWLKRALNVTAKPHCWIFDNFGQGPELPVLLRALGFNSVVFSRLPGTDYTLQNSTLKDDFVRNGYDFNWQASNKSISITAHYMGELYNVAESMKDCTQCTLMKFVQIYAGHDKESWEKPPSKYTAARTKFMWMPVADDFFMPVENLAADVAEWNHEGMGSTKSNVSMQLDTFDTFMDSLLQELQTSKQTLPDRQYNGTPYWTGHYATRPELKRLHFETTRTLVAAEIIGLLTQPNNRGVKHMLPTDFWERINQVWTDFAPSTHHDFINGTAPDAVYANEQLPILKGTMSAARSLCDAALNALGGMVSKTKDQTKIMIVNSLGFERGGIAAIEGIGVSSVGSLEFPDGTRSPTQISGDGGLLVYLPQEPSAGHTTQAPSLGYIVGIGSRADSAVQGATISMNDTSDVCTVGNEYLTAEIRAADNWNLSSLIDKGLGINILGQRSANEIVFFDETSYGDLYQFSTETTYEDRRPIGKSDVKITTSGPGLGAWIMEEGPLRVKLRTEVVIELLSRNEKIRFTRDYELHVGEPFLRMTTTGAAPARTSVMARFSFTHGADRMAHGTGYHWTDVQPLDDYWEKPVFRPTHDFLIPYYNSNSSPSFLGAIYHEAMPAWAIGHDDSLIGCLLRNPPPNDRHGATGSDTGRHTNRYALRIRSGLEWPTNGKVLREAQSFHTPLLAIRLPDGGPQNPGETFDGMLNEQSGSLASLSDNSQGIITAAKPGSYDPTSLVLRLYQPKNEAVSVKVNLPIVPNEAAMVTAVETPLRNADKIDMDPESRAITLPMKSPIVTISIHGQY